MPARRSQSIRGVENVSLDEVVAAAGVGKGTLYRIFGDRSGPGVLLAALTAEQIGFWTHAPARPGEGAGRPAGARLPGSCRPIAATDRLTTKVDHGALPAVVGVSPACRRQNTMINVVRGFNRD